MTPESGRMSPEGDIRAWEGGVLATHTAGLVKSADLLTPSEPDAGSSAPNGNI